MTKKRRRENLERLLRIENEYKSQGRRLSKAFYAMKEMAQQAVEA